jgi:hypothetical protein
VTQQFMEEASLLARKWQDKVGRFQELRKRALELVPELSPSFEEAKEEKGEAEEKKKEEKEGQGKTTVSPESCERDEYLTRGRVKVCGRSLLGPSFLDKEFHKKDYSPIFGPVRVAQDTRKYEHQNKEKQ